MGQWCEEKILSEGIQAHALLGKGNLAAVKQKKISRVKKHQNNYEPTKIETRSFYVLNLSFKKVSTFPCSSRSSVRGRHVGTRSPGLCCRRSGFSWGSLGVCGGRSGGNVAANGGVDRARRWTNTLICTPICQQQFFPIENPVWCFIVKNTNILGQSEMISY